MRYVVVFCVRTTAGITITSEVFFSKAKAELAKNNHVKLLKSSSWSGYSTIHPDYLFSPESLFVELLKNDPITPPETLLKRATDAYNLLYKDEGVVF